MTVDWNTELLDQRAEFTTWDYHGAEICLPRDLYRGSGDRSAA